MLKNCKTEINLTLEQIQKISKTIDTCRFVYNSYLAHNKEAYEKEKKFIPDMDLSKWLDSIYLKENPEYVWIKEVSSKSIRQSIMNQRGNSGASLKDNPGFQVQEKRQIGWQGVICENRF